MARFFIDRPIFAWVISIFIMGIGVLSILNLPVAQYPQIAPPSVAVRASYPGASAQTVANTVTQVIEQQMTGLDGLRYISSSSTSEGGASITLTFETGTDVDIAQVQVQNKLSQASALLPEPVQRQGITVQKSSAGFLMVIGLIGENGKYDATDLGDYMQSNLVNEISRVEGVGSVQVFGAQYAMRIWLDPVKLAAFELTPSDIVAAVSAENAQISAGSFGSRPAVEGQALNATITAQSLLTSPEDFRQIVLRAETDGGLVLLNDVARVESMLSAGLPLDAAIPLPSPWRVQRSLSALHAAAVFDAEDVADLLIERKASLDEQTSVDGTALMAAVIRRCLASSFSRFFICHLISSDNIID